MSVRSRRGEWRCRGPRGPRNNNVASTGQLCKECTAWSLATRVATALWPPTSAQAGWLLEPCTHRVYLGPWRSSNMTPLNFHGSGVVRRRIRCPIVDTLAKKAQDRLSRCSHKIVCELGVRISGSRHVNRCRVRDWPVCRNRRDWPALMNVRAVLC